MACAASGRKCEELGLYAHNAEIETQAKMEQILKHNCSFAYDVSRPIDPVVPSIGFGGDDSYCFASGPNRSISTFDCAAWSSGIKRLCYCEVTGKNGAAEGSTAAAEVDIQYLRIS